MMHLQLGLFVPQENKRSTPTGIRPAKLAATLACVVLIVFPTAVRASIQSDLNIAFAAAASAIGLANKANRSAGAGVAPAQLVVPVQAAATQIKAASIAMRRVEQDLRNEAKWALDTAEQIRLYLLAIRLGSRRMPELSVFEAMTVGEELLRIKASMLLGYAAVWKMTADAWYTVSKSWGAAASTLAASNLPSTASGGEPLAGVPGTMIGLAAVGVGISGPVADAIKNNPSTYLIAPPPRPASP